MLASSVVTSTSTGRIRWLVKYAPTSAPYQFTGTRVSAAGGRRPSRARAHEALARRALLLVVQDLARRVREHDDVETRQRVVGERLRILGERRGDALPPGSDAEELLRVTRSTDDGSPSCASEPARAACSHFPPCRRRVRRDSTIPLPPGGRRRAATSSSRAPPASRVRAPGKNRIAPRPAAREQGAADGRCSGGRRGDVVAHRADYPVPGACRKTTRKSVAARHARAGSRRQSVAGVIPQAARASAAPPGPPAIRREQRHAHRGERTTRHRPSPRRRPPPRRARSAPAVHDRRTPT